MEKLFRQLLISVGEDVNRQGLRDTPKRAAEAFRYLTRGYSQDAEEIVKDSVFESEAKEMILVKDIALYSLCEHHLLPFLGKCHVAYIPNGKVIGLSKVARLVDLFARRLQIQENLTKQIGEAILKYTDAAGVGVVIEAQHLCMTMRGVEKQDSVMTTSYLLGEFYNNPSTRAEFLSLVK